MCGKVYDTKRHSNVKAKAEYRRIYKYFKSLPKSKQEQARHEMVLQLWLSGYTISKIAVETKVSVRTVNRDLEKLRPTIKRRLDRLVGSTAEEQRLEIMKHLEGLNPVEQAQWIGRYLDEKNGLKVRRRRCHKLVITVNADAAENGVGALTFKPKFPTLVAPYVINFQLILKGRKQFVGQLQVR